MIESTRLSPTLVSSVIYMNCLFWNIRGVGKGEKALTIRSIVKKKKITFMGLVETKHRKKFQPRMKRLWGNDDYDFC